MLAFYPQKWHTNPFMNYTVSHIIWDFNGTLLDDTLASLNAVNIMLLRRRLPLLSLAEYRDMFGFPVKNFYAKAGFQLEAEDWDKLADEYYAAFFANPSIKVREDAAKVLQFFKLEGVAQSLLSAAEHEMLLRMVKTAGIEAFFTHVFGSDNRYGLSKLEQARNLLVKLNRPPDSVLLIGDTLHDAEVAGELGFQCMLISDGHQSEERLRETGYPVFRTLSELASHKTRLIYLGGSGKGKTSSALGMILRAVGHGMKISLIQFIKNCPEIGEISALRRFPEVSIHQAGLGFVFPGNPPRKMAEHRRAIQDGLALARTHLEDPSIKMVVLDEITDAIELGLITVRELLEAVNRATSDKLIIITGHALIPEVVNHADTVSRVDNVKHIFKNGFSAQEGIEL